jgi:hypothetical protein
VGATSQTIRRINVRPPIARRRSSRFGELKLSENRLKNRFNFVLTNGDFLRVLEFNGAPRPMKMGTTASPWRYDVAACHAIETPILRCSAISYCASRQSPERLSPPAWTLLASVLSLAATV